MAGAFQFNAFEPTAFEVGGGDVTVAITGNQAVGAVGNFGFIYWSVINDNQTPNWTTITTI
jgi:hypothetical protein